MFRATGVSPCVLHFAHPALFVLAALLTCWNLPEILP